MERGCSARSCARTSLSASARNDLPHTDSKSESTTGRCNGSVDHEIMIQTALRKIGTVEAMATYDTSRESNIITFRLVCMPVTVADHVVPQKFSRNKRNSLKDEKKALNWSMRVVN